MQVTVIEHPGFLSVRASGLLSLRTAPVLLQCLLKAAAEQPRGLVCDLSDTRATREGLTVLNVITDRVADWPGTPLVLVTADPTLQDLLQRLGLHRRLPVVSDLGDVPTALRQAPRLLLAATQFPPMLDAPAAARAFVAHTLTRWHALEFVPEARCVASELVTNAVLHAKTELTVRVSLAGHRVGVAVADRGPTTAVRLTPHDGRGLRIVQAVSSSWGSMPRLDGGTVVWAVLGTVGDRPVLLPRQTGRGPDR